MDDAKAAFAIERWAEAHPPYVWSKEDLGVDLLDCNWEEMQREADASTKVDEAWQGELTVEDVSDLKALFYVGRESEFGEHYEPMYREALEKNQFETNVWVYVHHLTCKTNLLDAVARGCEIVGRPSLAARLRAIRP